MKITAQIIAKMKSELEKIGQSNAIPLFGGTPAKVNYEAVDGNVTTNTFGNKIFIVSVSKDAVGYPVTGDTSNLTDGPSTMNIGTFTCLRDHVSARNNKFEAGKTQRTFAYQA